MAQDATPTTTSTADPQPTPVSSADVANATVLNQALSQIQTSVSNSSTANIAAANAIAAAITKNIIGGVVGTTANALLRVKTVSSGSISGSIQNSPVVCDNAGSLTGVTAVVVNNNGGLYTDKGGGDVALLAAYNTNTTAYVIFGTLTVGNPPTFNLASSVTLGGVGIATLNTNTWNQQQGFAQATLTDASPITWNGQTQQTAYVLLTSGIGATRQLQNISNPVAGFTYVLEVQQSSTGSNALTYGSIYTWPGGVVPALSTANNAIDVLTFYYDGTKMRGVMQHAFA